MTLKLLFVGDGPRDGVVIPPIVVGILGTEVDAELNAWKDVRLQSGGKGLRGYARKLLYLIRRARDRSANGIVATVDSDNDRNREKLADLVSARTKDRTDGNATPVALGEAVPHLEAWLLDDEVAVRTALRLPTDTRIESPTKVKSCKDELDRLCSASGINKPILEVLAGVALQLESNRCIHAEQTGFQQFSVDVVSELGPLCRR